MRWFQRELKDIYALEVKYVNEQSIEHVHIKRGKYKGVRYIYGAVRMDPPENGETPVLHFRFRVFENPRNKDVTSDEFRNLTGDILTDLMTRTNLSEHIVSDLKEQYAED